MDRRGSWLIVNACAQGSDGSFGVMTIVALSIGTQLCHLFNPRHITPSGPDHAASRFPSFTSFCIARNMSAGVPPHEEVSRIGLVLCTYQSLHRTMQRMPMIPSKLRVCAFERGIAVGFRLLDPVMRNTVSAKKPANTSPMRRSLCWEQGLNYSLCGSGSVPVAVSLLALVVLRRIL